MNTKMLAFGFLIWLLVFVIDLVRRERLTFKYAAGWILLAIGGMALVSFDHLIALLSRALGFALPSNFIFFCAVVGGVLMSLFLTLFLCQQNNHNDRMAQKIGLLENEINELKKKVL